MTRKRKGNGNGNGNGYGFNWATVAQMLLIPMLTGGVYFLIQWGTQGDTLKRHDLAITDTIPKEFKAESDAREKTRNEFLDKFDKLNQGIATLNTNVAVQTQALQQLQLAIAPRH